MNPKQDKQRPEGFQKCCKTMKADSPKPSPGSPEALLTMGKEELPQQAHILQLTSCFRFWLLAAARDPGSLGPQTSYRGYVLGFSAVTWLVGVSTCPRGRSLWFQAWVLSAE